MTTDENILEEMLERVTNPDKDIVDDLAVQMFCMIVKSNSGLVTKAHELIVKKIHSTNTIEAARAIGVLEECMSKGGLEFQKKSAKFTFLNELIALVLDKHSGVPVPIDTKKRIMECLMLWTVEHQDKTKIIEAYENLRKQVHFEHGPSMVNASSPALSSVREQRSSILGKDDQLVAKLLKQGGEENYKKANLLIQHRFNQEARRTEFICHLKSELKKIESTMEVLEEMLNSYSSDTPGADTREIMQELYNTCKGHNEQMARWPDFLGDGEPEFLDDVLNTKDLLMVVLLNYKENFENETNINLAETLLKPTATTTTNTATSKTSANTDLLTDLLGDSLSTSQPDTNPTMTTNPPQTSNNSMEELNAIFGSLETRLQASKLKMPSEILGNMNLLEPVNVFESEMKNNATTATTARAALLTNGKDKDKKAQGFKELREIDKLSEEMFKQNLNDEQRLLSFKKETEKLTLNDLAKDKVQTSLINTKAADPIPSPVKAYIFEKVQMKEKPDNTDELVNELKDLKESNDNKLEIQNRFNLENQPDLEKELDEDNKTFPEINMDSKTGYSDNKKTLPLKPLAEIEIDLDDVTPLEEKLRVLLDDDDIQVTLNFTANRPSSCVSVIVMSVTNKSKLPVNEFQFEASVKKPCKVRLLTPTSTAMAPSKPFRPAAPINQVVLLLNPTLKPVDITCIIGYKLGDDPDPIKESIKAKDIPYVE